MELNTAQVFDACLRHDLAPRLAPPGVRPLDPAMHVVAPVVVAPHVGSVDIFLEVAADAPDGAVLVIDNQGRTDESCIGDLTVLECQAQGLAGMIVWGAHRDDAELRAIGWPVWSLGSYPGGPLRLDARQTPRSPIELNGVPVQDGDMVIADGNGALFVASDAWPQVRETAEGIAAKEREQSARIAAGETLYEQLRVAAYINKRDANPEHTFRAHLRTEGGAIEE